MTAAAPITASSLPTMSFLMITYNQERYIAQALESALAQDYPALEIIICDDASKDRTFEIASDIAAHYHGPFSIILHRNGTNLGIGANFYQAYSLAHGDWLFMAAGDDISLPNRCRAVADAIQQFPQALAFGSNYQVIDGNGLVKGYFSPENPLLPGAVLCWHRSIFESFEPLGRHLRVEDVPLLTRVFCLGGVVVKQPYATVQYRMDGHSFTEELRDTPLTVKKAQLKISQTMLDSVRQRLADLDYLKQHGRTIQYEDIFTARQTWAIHEIERVMASYQLSLDVLQGSVALRLHYLITKSDLIFHNHFSFRLKTLLSSFSWLRKIKHLIIPLKDGLPLFVEQQLVSQLPADLKPMMLTLENYLLHEDYDYFHAEDRESFTRDYLFPERRKQLLKAHDKQKSSYKQHVC